MWIDGEYLLRLMIPSVVKCSITEVVSTHISCIYHKGIVQWNYCCMWTPLHHNLSNRFRLMYTNAGPNNITKILNTNNCHTTKIYSVKLTVSVQISAAVNVEGIPSHRHRTSRVPCALSRDAVIRYRHMVSPGLEWHGCIEVCVLCDNIKDNNGWVHGGAGVLLPDFAIKRVGSWRYGCLVTWFRYQMDRVMEVRPSCYLVLLSTDSKTR